MSFKQRDVTGGEQLWDNVPGYNLANYLLRIVAIPAESILRARFGRRYHTMPNFIAGLVALLAFNYSGLILAVIMTIFGNPIVGGIGLFAMGSGAGSELMTSITYAYLLIGTFHFLEEWVQRNVLGNLRHTFTEGTSWLFPLGKRLMLIVNPMLKTGVRFIATFLPGEIRGKVEQALPQLVLTSDKWFTERFLDPLFLFILAVVANSFGEATVGIWLLVSIPGLNMMTRVRYARQADQAWDIIDSYLDSQELRGAMNGGTADKYRFRDVVSQSGSIVDRSPEVMEVVRKKAPTVADAIEADRLRKKAYNGELVH